MIRTTFKLYNENGPIDTYIKMMPLVPREGELVRLWGFIGPVAKVTWYPGNDLDVDPSVEVRVYV